MRPALSLFLAALAFAVIAPASAEEGMWVPQQLPEISAPLREAGLRLAPAQLTDLAGDPMGAVVSLGGCTASFVSPTGLVATAKVIAHAPVRLESTDGRISRFPRAWARITMADGRTGVGWLEWNRNTP